MRIFKALILSALLAIILIAPLTGCGNGGGTAGVYCFWIAASKDATVYGDWPEMNNPGGFSLEVTTGDPNGERRSYVQFYNPQFPPGTVVLAAFLQFWEDSDQGVPAHGTYQIEIGRAVDEWLPDTITWENQPNPPGPFSIGASLGPFIEANMWRTSGDIANIVQLMLDDPASDFGWVLGSGGYNQTRSFASINALNGRTVSTLGTAPRLLLKVDSPVPLNMLTVFPVVPDGNEPSEMYPGEAILWNNFSPGNTWPAWWEVGTM